MPSPYRKAQLGDRLPLSALLHNAGVEAAKSEKSRQLSIGQRRLTSTPNSTIVRVTNGTGIDLLRYDVVALDEPIFLPTDSLDAFLQAPTFKGVVPTSAHAGRFGILLDAVPNAPNITARAVVSGVCQVQIDVLDESDRFADVDNGEPSNLISGPTGAAEILWRQGDESEPYYTGLQWALVRIGGGGGSGGGMVDLVIAEDVPPAVWVSGNVMAASGTGYRIDADGNVTSSTLDFASRFPDGVTAPRYVIVARIGNEYRLIDASCSTVPAPPYY